MTEGHTGRLEAALTGRYRIERKLGEGGMASVYLAEDLKHERKVALKILRPELAAVIGAERFLSEIKTTANLQHPHILALFDSGEAGGYLYYVMPYIDGETLREKLDREKQFGMEEAIGIARDVADALDYAHRAGVIHRDIKPGNILLHDGRPVVADFGIALAVSAAGGGRMTETGLSLGTPHYMSPEQASADRDLSARSDVYSLGCVLYEMIAGQPPHTGPSAQSILVHILTKEVTPLPELRHTVPPHVAAAVAKAIEKLPADRFDTAKQFRDALHDTSFSYLAATRPHATTAQTAVGSPAGSAATRPWLSDRRSAASLAAAALLAAWGAWGWLRPEPVLEPGVPTRAEVTLTNPGPGGGWKYAISPDGRWLAASAVDRGGAGLFIRSAEDPEWRLLPNTGGASNPTFSPDGQSVAFQTGNAISKVPITGGPALPLGSGRDPHWGLDDTVVFEGDAGGLYRVGSSGGEPELLFLADTIRVTRPHLLPGGRGVVFGTQAGPGSRIVLFDVDRREVRPLAPAGGNPRYVRTGHIVYGHDSGTLMGVAFDLETLQATGSPVTLLPELSVAPAGGARFGVSESGTLFYDASTTAGGGIANTLAEVALDGTESPLPLAPGQLDAPRYSPDGRRIAYVDRTTLELRIFDVLSGANPQFVTGGYPVWSRSGEYLYFADPITGPGIAEGHRRRADGGEPSEQLWSIPGGEYPADISPGDSILVVRVDEGSSRDIRLWRPGAGSGELQAFLVADWNEINGEISPDGRWIAYQSDESGEYRVYVHSFPVITGQRPVSPGLGAEPLWSPDGGTLYYRSGSRVMAVAVQTDPDFSLLSAPRELFDRPEYTRYQNPGPSSTWDIHPDGTRFVVVKSPDESGGDTGAELYLVTNWFEELRQRMGTP